VWTSALLHVLKGLGFEEQAARQGIARGVAADGIGEEKHGRDVRWVRKEASKRLYSALGWAGFGNPAVRGKHVAGGSFR